jgi:zinc protease
MLKKIPLLLLLLILFIPAGPALAQEPQAEIDFADYLPNIVDYSLPNGLRVILAEDHSAPVVATDIWYYVGAANDPPGRSGFAHMFEHMMFRGSANVADGQYDALLESVGAIKNAYTDIDKTAYWSVAPAHQLPLVLWLESDRMASLDVTEEHFVTERSVVNEEFNERVANNPYGASGRRLFTQPFQGYPPYERSVIGDMDNLAEAQLEELQAFHESYYKPNNAVLTIAGDIDIEITQALVQAYFADIPPGDPLVPITQQYPVPDEFPILRTDEATGCNIGTEEVLLDSLAQLPRYTASVVGPPRGHADYYALNLLADILGSGDSSRLQQNIAQQGLAAAAFIGLSDNLGASTLYTGIIPNGGDALEAAQELLRQEFDKIRADGVTQKELDRVKQRARVGAVTSFRESTRNTAEWLQDAALNFGDPTAMVAELEQYEAVAPADIQRVAQTYLCDKPMNTLITLSAGEEVLADYPGLLVEPAEIEPVDEPGSEVVAVDVEAALAGLPEGVVSRSKPPTPLPVTESNFPPFETFTLDNGLEVIFVEQNEVPKLQLQLYFGGGSAATPADKQGVADFMAELLTKGTAIRSAADIANRIESVGGSVGASADLEWTSLSINALSTDARLAFNMLADLARHSTFPQKEFDVVKEQTLTFLEQDEVNADTLANRQFGRIAYVGHPYGNYTSKESVANITRDDVVELYNTTIKPNNALLVIVGDITLEEARRQTERVFGGWQPGETPDFLDYPEAEVGDASVIYLVDRPDSEQATLQIGNKGINARNPDRYALIVANAVLGSGSTSRLYSNLRDQKGYTYGIYSRFGRPNDTSTFRVLSDVDQAHAADAIREILAELERIRTEEIPAEELEANKGLIIGSFALAIEDPADFAAQLSNRHLTGVPIEELYTYLQNISNVSAEEAMAAAAKYIDTKQPIIVVVGNAEVLKPQLEALGQVVVVDKDGQVLDK